MVTSPDFSTPANPLNRTITYDMDNMPTRIVHANGTTVDFTYDGMDKRSKKAVQGGKTVLYLGDHYEVENGVGIKYIFGGNLRLAMIKGSLISYFHKDHLGSTAAITDQNGNKVEGTQYEPFGSTRTHEGTSVSSYKFTDQELDNETGLYNYDARLYDPILGMFVTADSIVPGMFDPQMFNRYAYCRNNPLIYVDPSGHGLGQAWQGGPEENINGKGPLVDMDKKPKDVPSWDKVFKHAGKWLKREKTPFGRWLNWGEEKRTIQKMIDFEIKSYLINLANFMFKNNINNPQKAAAQYAMEGYISDENIQSYFDTTLQSGIGWVIQTKGWVDLMAELANIKNPLNKIGPLGIYAELYAGTLATRQSEMMQDVWEKYVMESKKVGFGGITYSNSFQDEAFPNQGKWVDVFHASSNAYLGRFPEYTPN